MHQLLSGDWIASGALRLNSRLSLDELADAALFADARTLLEPATPRDRSGGDHVACRGIAGATGSWRDGVRLVAGKDRYQYSRRTRRVVAALALAGFAMEDIFLSPKGLGCFAQARLRARRYPPVRTASTVA